MATLTTSFQKIGTGTQKTYGQSAGYLELWAKYNSQDVVNNRTNVTVELRLVVPYGYIGNYQATYWSIGGSLSNSGNLGSDNYRSRTLGSATGNISHSGDGTGSVSFTGGFDPTAWGITLDVSGSAVLPTIPRASTITATSVYAGETSQITVTRKNDSFTHSIYFIFGELSGYVLEDGTTTSTPTTITQTSIGFPIPKTWLQQIPNSQEGNCSLTIKTYSGNSQIGSQQNTTFKVRVDTSPNSESRPTVTSSVEDTNNTTYALTGNRSILVKGYSTAEVTYSANANDYATLSSVTINGATVTQSPYSFVLQDNVITVTATDSRGLDKTSTPSFTLKDYFEPNLTVSSERVEPTSDSAYITFDGTWFNDTFGSVQNTLTIKWKYKRTGSTTWIDGGTLVRDTDYTINGNNVWSGTGNTASQIEIGGSLDYNYDWDIGLFINDRLVTLSEIVAPITKGIPIINWEEDYFNVNGDIRQNNTSIFAQFTYSSDERVVGTWFGKTLYSKTISTTTAVLPNTMLNIPYDIPNVKEVWIDYGKSFYHAINTDRSYGIEYIYYSTNNTLAFSHAFIQSGSINLIANDGWNTNWTKYITLLYTKTTD